MHARSSTVYGHPQAVDDGVRYVRDKVMPAVSGMDGYVGLSMLADRDSGRCIITTAWEDRDAMRRSADGVRAMRARAADILQGPAEVHEWEIAVLHRERAAPEGARTRVVWVTGHPDGMDRVVDAFAESVVPRLADLPGFCSVSLLADRDAGRGAIAVTYASRAAQEEALPRATAMREEFTSRMGLEVPDVGTFDLLLAHLRVPETV